MAAREPYDYLSTITPDVDITLSIKPQGSIIEEGTKNQKIFLGDDGSEKRISLDYDSIFYVVLPWNVLSEANAGTFLDLWHETSKANCIANTF